MKRKTIKRIFWVFILLLPVQYAVVGIVGFVKSEPWPAFVLPAFKGVFDAQAQTVIRRTTFSIKNHQADKPITIPPYKLFKGIQHSQLRGFLRNHFSNSRQLAKLDPEAKIWMKNRIHQYYPSWKGDTLYLKWVDEYYNFTPTGVRLDSTRLSKSFTISL